jgi:hypothetical protein
MIVPTFLIESRSLVDLPHVVFSQPAQVQDAHKVYSKIHVLEFLNNLWGLWT